MRSMHLMAASTVILAAAWACGGDGGNVEPNTPPVAAFTAPSCTVNTACAFTDASTDDHGITSRLWNFGDDHAATPADNQSTDANPTHTYIEAKSYTVSLTVTDASGETNTKTNTVVVSAGGPANQPPTASFDLPTCTAGTPCGFHSTSTDADGQIASANWDFGDGETGEGNDVTHTFAAAGAFNVTLTVTDDKGAPGTATHQITVSPAASQDCTTTSGTLVDCSLGITQQSTVKVTLDSLSCELAGNRLAVTAPAPQTVFFNLCGRTPGQEYTLKDATGAALVIPAGTQLALRFFQGTADPTDPPTGDPGIKVTGSFPTWKLRIDDGGAAGSPGEPDFNDAVLTVQATPSP